MPSIIAAPTTDLLPTRGALVIADMRQFVTDDKTFGFLYLRMLILAQQEASEESCADYELDQKQMLAMMMHTIRALRHYTHCYAANWLPSRTRVGNVRRSPRTGGQPQPSSPSQKRPRQLPVTWLAKQAQPPPWLPTLLMRQAPAPIVSPQQR